MTSPPTVVTGRRRQHGLLRSWSGWGLTSIPIDPAEIARIRRAGWAGTHRRDPDTGERIVGTPDGLGLGFGFDETGCSPVEVIPWSQIEAIAKSVPDELQASARDRLVKVSAASIRLAPEAPPPRTHRT